VAHTVFVDSFLPHDGKSMLDAFSERQRKDELAQIAENQGRWSAPDVTAEANRHGLSTSRHGGWRSVSLATRGARYPNPPS
jgi:hypothetical protein